MEKENIKHVAIYLRKSRDEGDTPDVLSKHRDTLLTLVGQQGWSYQLYEEVVSGERIEHRKEMQRLVEDVEKQSYDGVVVMDIDRLGRGENRDWAIIKDAFLYSETLIITPGRIYDLEKDDDDVSFDFKSIFARMEYKTIKRRMQQGKIAAAKKGMWTNGKPPFPYYYDRNTKQLLVDETKRGIYRSMVERYLEGENLHDIAMWLTTNNIPTPRIAKPDSKEKGWSLTTVRRVLLNEIHLGKIIYGVRKYKRGKIEFVPKQNQVRVIGQHECLKSKEEHEAIVERFEKNKEINPNGRRHTLTLSGLMHCQKCGYKMRLKVRETKKSGLRWDVKCSHRYLDGTTCEQSSKIIDDEFLSAIYDKIIQIDASMLYEMTLHNKSANEAKSLIGIKEKEAQVQKNALEKIYSAFEEGIISREVFLERQEKRRKEIKRLENELVGLYKKYEGEQHYPSVTEMNERIEDFKLAWKTSVSDTDKNKALKKVVEKIFYDREGNQITLNILYK